MAVPQGGGVVACKGGRAFCGEWVRAKMEKGFFWGEASKWSL